MKKILPWIGGGRLQVLLVICFSLVATLTVSVFAVSVSRLIQSHLEAAEDERVARDMDLAQAFYAIKRQDIADSSYHLATNPETILNFKTATQGEQAAKDVLFDHLHGYTITPNCNCLNSILFLDTQGNIISGNARTSQQISPDRIDSGNWGALPILQSTLKKKQAFSTIEVIPVEFLAQIGLADQARIQNLSTERANPTPYDSREGTAGFALVSTHPILDEQGNLLGSVLALYLFNNDTTMVDNIRDVAGIDTVTIFFGDLRIATNVLNEDGSRAIGTRVSQEVYNTVLVNGTSYQGRAFVVNEWYITRYDPLHNHLGQVVGSIYVGARASAFQMLIRSFNLRVAVIALVSIIAAGIIATLIARLLTKPIDALVQANRSLTQGNMMVRVPDYGDGEIGILAQSFNTMADALGAARQELERLDRFKSDFMRMVAHELNSPIGGALSMLRTLLAGMGGELSPRQADVLRRVEKRMGSLQTLVGDLLTLAAAKSVPETQSFEPVELTEILSSVVDQYSVEAQQKGLNLNYKPPSQPIRTFGTRDGYLKIFSNLIGNAVKYTPSGGEVWVRVDLEPDDIRVEIQDSGIGIPAESLSKLGEELFRASNAREADIPGTGLGLSIAKYLVEQFDGRMEVQSEEGEGSLFRVQIKRI